MALADDLLEQAKYLAGLGAKRPKQADLRRAVSTAYYALFHLLVQEAARRLSRGAPTALTQQISRAFSHQDMKQACSSIYGQPSAVLAALQPEGFSPELRSVAREFVDLQGERHDADYDLSQSYSRLEVLDLLVRAERAFQTWKRIRLNEEANVFRAALLLSRLWGR